MILPNDATSIIRSFSEELGVESVPLDKAEGRILKEVIYADRNYPAFNRACMDGIAILPGAIEQGIVTFDIEGVLGAGEEPFSPSTDNACIEIMTGAATPQECGAIIRYEDLEIDGTTATLAPKLVIKNGQNIQNEGQDYQKAEPLITPGVVINGIHIGILASVGKSEILVSKKALITVVTTGTELVPVDHDPKPWQIRQSNLHTITAFINRLGIAEVSGRHIADDKLSLTEGIEEVLAKSDIVILTGGVSKGKYDYVPEVLESLEVTQQFHRVKQRPGKPMWFGTGTEGQLVFGLPGNPVPVIMGVHRYVVPALMQISGLAPHQEPMMVEIADEVNFKPELQYFMPVTLIANQADGIKAIPKTTNGSGDFYSLADSDGFVELSWDRTTFEPGYRAPYYPWIMNKTV